MQYQLTRRGAAILGVAAPLFYVRPPGLAVRRAQYPPSREHLGLGIRVWRCFDKARLKVRDPLVRQMWRFPVGPFARVASAGG